MLDIMLRRGLVGKLSDGEREVIGSRGHRLS